MLNFRLLLLLILAFTLTGCGFHLRGYEPLPAQLKILYLQTNAPYDDFTKQIKTMLSSAKVTLVEHSVAAPLTLQILTEGSSSQLTGTSASGQTNTYSLAYSVTYQILNRQGAVIQAPQIVTVTRSYSVTSNQVLGDTNVQNNLIIQMQRDAIYQIMNRLRSPETLRELSAKLNTIS